MSEKRLVEIRELGASLLTMVVQLEDIVRYMEANRAIFAKADKYLGHDLASCPSPTEVHTMILCQSKISALTLFAQAKQIEHILEGYAENN